MANSTQDLIFSPRCQRPSHLALVGWRHAFGDTTPLAAQAFVFAAGNTFTIAGTPIAKDAAVLEAGLDFAISDNTSLGLSDTGQFGSHARDNGAKVDLSVKF